MQTMYYGNCNSMKFFVTQYILRKIDFVEQERLLDG